MFLLILALCVATTILVALVGYYVPVLRAFWNLL